MIRAAAILAMLACVLQTATLRAEPSLTVMVEGGRQEPGFVRLRIRVEPDDSNRALVVAAWSPDIETSSYEQLDGVRARRTRWIEWRDLPAGTYDVVAVVHRPPARSWRATAGFVVL